MLEDSFVIQRKFFARAVFGFALLSLCFRLVLQATPGFWLKPPLFELIYDYTYWLFQLSGLRNLLVEQHWAAVLFNILLFCTCVLCVALPLKNVFPAVFFFLFLIYALSYNSVIVHHAHPLSMLTIASLPFVVRSPKLWHLLWQGFRYYVCFVYVASFLWKARGGSLWYPLMGEGALKSNLAAYLYLYPDSFLSGTYQWLLTHPVFLQWGTVLIFSLEGLMIIGFFTRRWDKLLLWLPIFIHGATYFFADVFFMEMWVGVLPFITHKQLTTIQSFFKRTNTEH